MFLSSCLAVLLAAPPQGVTVQVPAPRLEAAPPTAADAVSKAVKEELGAQGYGTVAADAPGQAQVSSRVQGLDGGCLVTLTLTRTTDGLILDEERERAASQEDLGRATRAAVRRIAAEMRLTWGVRVKVKSK